MKALGWTASIVLGVVIVAIELLPIVFGTGEEATLDWSFTYVTFRFILLPVASFLHVVTNLSLFVFWNERTLKERVVQLTSIVIPLAFLTYSHFVPLPLFDRFL